MRGSLYTILTFVKINTRRFFRDRVALFFTIGFPLIFLFVFGGLSSGGSDISFNVAVVNRADNEIAAQFVDQLKGSNVVRVDEEVLTLEVARDKMSRSEIDATIVLPKTFGSVRAGETMPSGEAEVLYTQSNQQSAQALGGLLEGTFKSINSRIADTDVPFTVKSTQLNERSLSAFDYTFAGLLGFAIIGMGIFGPVNVFPELKKMGILRRLSTTPLKVWQYFLSITIGQAAIGLISLAIMFVIAMTVFDLRVVGNYFELAVFLILSITMILGIGLALGGWAKNERQVAPLANIVAFPMMFLSGTFFPRFLMPEWLQNISTYLPLTPVIDGIRLITTEGKHFIDILPQISLIGAWMVVIYVIAFRVFRWE